MTVWRTGRNRPLSFVGDEGGQVATVQMKVSDIVHIIFVFSLLRLPTVNDSGWLKFQWA